MKIKFYDNEDKLIKETEAPDSNYCLITNGSDSFPEYDNGFHFLKLDEANAINQTYQETARMIANKYSTLLHKIYPHEIAFIVDEVWEPSDKSSINSKWKIEIARAPKWFKLCYGFEYIVKMRGHWIEKWTSAQINAAIMSQLLRINPADGSIFKYTEDFNSKMVATFGHGYLEPQTVIPNVLEEDVKIIGFREASGQMTIDELPSNPSEDEDEQAS